MTAGAAIRPATAADAPVLAKLRFAFRSAITPPTETEPEFVARCERWMAERLADDRGWWAWLATDGGDAIGTVWLHRLEKLPNPVGEREAIGYITNFFVCPDARGAGVGTALLRTVLGACESRGFGSVILWPTPRSRPLYERHGFASREDVFVRVFG